MRNAGRSCRRPGKLTAHCREKGKTGESYKLSLSKNFSYNIEKNGVITLINRNMEFEISERKLYKIVNICYNPSQIVSRLMTGDLYHCLMILETTDISKYGDFIEYENRLMLEDDLLSRIRATKEFSRLNIGIHPILDINKTERQLRVVYKGVTEPIVIGNETSRKLLIGIFIKNDPYGLKHAKFFFRKKS